MNEIPEDMKRSNWAFFVLARSSEPAIIIQNTRHLVSNLISSMVIADEGKYNKTLLKCIGIANDAWAKFSRDNDIGGAVQDCHTVLDQITPLLYDTRWSISQPDAFSSPSKGGT